MEDSRQQTDPQGSDGTETVRAANDPIGAASTSSTALSLYTSSPMSAFLAFSNKRRAALKRENPDATNADLSRMLSVTWKEAPQDVRRKYMEEEAELRAKYKVEMAKWKQKQAENKRIERQEREALALQAAEARSAEQANGQQQQQMPPQMQLPNLAAAAAVAAQAAPGDLANGVVAHPNFFNPWQMPGFNAFQAVQQQAQQQQPQQLQQQQTQQPEQAQQQVQAPGADQSQQQQQQQQYANMMAGNPFAQQQFATAAQQQLLSQLFSTYSDFPSPTTL